MQNNYPANRLPAADSAAGKRETMDWLMHCSSVEPELAPGQKKLTRFELYQYRRYLSGKLRWRTSDYETLLRLVRTDSLMRDMEKELQKAGPIYYDAKGMPKAHPVVAMIKQTDEQRLRLIRMLNLGATYGGAVDPSLVGHTRSTRGGGQDAPAPAGDDHDADLLRLPV